MWNEKHNVYGWNLDRQQSEIKEAKELSAEEKKYAGRSFFFYQEIRRGITRSCKKLVFFPEHPQKIWTECPIGVIIQTLDIVALPCPYPGFSKRGGNRNPAEHQPEKSQSNFWSSFFKEDKIKWLER